MLRRLALTMCKSYNKTLYKDTGEIPSLLLPRSWLTRMTAPDAYGESMPYFLVPFSLSLGGSAWFRITVHSSPHYNLDLVSLECKMLRPEYRLPVCMPI